MTLNTGNRSSFVLGDNYVEFLNVHPDSTGNIFGFWGAVSNPISGLSGEGDFNGLQFVAVPEPSVMGILGIGIFGWFARRNRSRK